MDTWLGLLVGGAALLAGAELLVKGASRLAVSVGISPLVVGLTVVAFGTSAPEVAVTVGASFSGEVDIALGNVVGSNIANVLLILGLSALVAPSSWSNGWFASKFADLLYRLLHLPLGRRAISRLFYGVHALSPLGVDPAPGAHHPGARSGLRCAAADRDHFGNLVFQATEVQDAPLRGIQE